MSTVRRRISLILLVVTLLSLLPRADAYATPRGGTTPLPTAVAQSAPLPTLTQLPPTDPPASAIPTALDDASDPIDPAWDDEHYPLFNPVLAKPFVVGTYPGFHTRAHTVMGPGNTLHSVFYQYAQGTTVGGWYYTTSPHLKQGMLTATTPITAALVVAMSEPAINGIYARIAVDDGGLSRVGI